VDIEKEISKALEDPELMSKLGNVLSSLTGTGGSEKTEENGQPGIEKNMFSALSSTVSDERTNLLMAIKPFLSEKRAPYMDGAVAILKLAKMGKIGKDLKLF